MKKPKKLINRIKRFLKKINTQMEKSFKGTNPRDFESPEDFWRRNI